MESNVSRSSVIMMADTNNGSEERIDFKITNPDDQNSSAASQAQNNLKDIDHNLI